MVLIIIFAILFLALVLYLILRNNKEKYVETDVIYVETINHPSDTYIIYSPELTSTQLANLNIKVTLMNGEVLATDGSVTLDNAYMDATDTLNTNLAFYTVNSTIKYSSSNKIEYTVPLLYIEQEKLDQIIRSSWYVPPRNWYGDRIIKRIEITNPYYKSISKPFKLASIDRIYTPVMNQQTGRPSYYLLNPPQPYYSDIVNGISFPSDSRQVIIYNMSFFSGWKRTYNELSCGMSRFNKCVKICKDDRKTGPNCESCISNFTGANCDCPARYAGPSCDMCSLSYTGINCESCSSRFTGANCATCVYRFSGKFCDDCSSRFTGTNCVNCSSRFTGTNCVNCVYRFTGENCEGCSLRFTGENCEGCSSRFTGANCSNCLPMFTGSDCQSCYRGWTGDTCERCLTNWTGTNCERCSNAWTGATCTVCPSNWKGDNCNNCSNAWTGAICNVCPPNWTGTNCNRCSSQITGTRCDKCLNGWITELCTVCPSNYDRNNQCILVNPSTGYYLNTCIMDTNDVYIYNRIDGSRMNQITTSTVVNNLDECANLSTNGLFKIKGATGSTGWICNYGGTSQNYTGDYSGQYCKYTNGIVHGTNSIAAVYNLARSASYTPALGDACRSGFNLIMNHRVKSYSCGSVYTIIIRDDDTMWGWGFNDGSKFSQYSIGVLGTVNTNNLLTLTKLNDEKWSKVYCMTVFTIGIKLDGTLWYWGRGVLSPTKLTDNTWRMAALQRRQSYSYEGVLLAIDTSGFLWVIDIVNNSINKLGNDNDWKTLNVATNLSPYAMAMKNNGTLWIIPYATDGTITQDGTDSDWKDVIVFESSYPISYAVKNSGELWVRNARSWTPPTYPTAIDTPVTSYYTKVDIGPLRVKKFIAMRTIPSFAILDESGKIYTCGIGSFGHLGQDTTNTNERILAEVVCSGGVCPIFTDVKFGISIQSDPYMLAKDIDNNLWLSGRDTINNITYIRLSPIFASCDPI